MGVLSGMDPNMKRIYLSKYVTCIFKLICYSYYFLVMYVNVSIYFILESWYASSFHYEH